MGHPSDRAELAETTPPTLRQWLQQRPFALAMSSGFFSFYAHCGVLAALLQAGLRPHRVAGSSAGGLVAGLWAAGLDIDQLRQQLVRLRREDFWDPALGLGLLRGRRLRAHLQRILPVSHFSDCRVPLTVSVFDLARRQTSVVDDGLLVSALQATCALPLLFQPVRVQNRWCVDGGVADRPGLAGVAARSRVLHHHIVAQSPWRRRASAALCAPQRQGMLSLEIFGLQRVHPFALSTGLLAYLQAHRATVCALMQPIYTSNTVADLGPAGPADLNRQAPMHMLQASRAAGCAHSHRA